MTQALFFFKINFKRFLKLYLTNPNWLVNHLLCYLLFLIISHLVLSNIAHSIKLGTSLILLITTFITSISPFHELDNDFKSGHLQQFMILGVWKIIPTSFYLISRIIVINISFIALQPLALLILGIPIKMLIPLIIATTITISYNTLISYIISCLSLNNNSTLLLPILSLPLSIPGVLLAELSLEHTQYNYIAFSIIMALIPINILLGEKIISASLSNS